MRTKTKRISILFVLLLLLMTCLSLADTAERTYETEFDQSAMRTHIEALTANGPRSIFHSEANGQGLDYIARTLRSWGVRQGDRTDTPAFVVQDFVAEDTDYQSWYLKNIIVHIPANDPQPSGQALMLMGHTDSVPMGDGASDDGVAVATMLEAIRTYLDRMDQGLTLKNDLVFCFVNGEEYGLYGSWAYMNEFTGFNDVVSRTRFGINLESRGTDGTLIMFETAPGNLDTVRLFSKVNDNVFTCSIATLIYEQMPNGTDFSNFKHAMQGLNFANIAGGENYHTQNDDLEHLGDSYLSQNAMIVDELIGCLGDYDLDRLYGSEENAIFFSYLNLGTPVYSRSAAMLFAAAALALLLVSILRGRGTGRWKRTGLALAGIFAGLALTAAATQVCYYLFQFIAVLAGVIDLHAVGTITFSNRNLVIGIGLLCLTMIVIAVRHWRRWFRLSTRDMNRAFAYLHGILGSVLTLALPEASYLFIFSGIALLANELFVGSKTVRAMYRGELLVTALYLPLVMPILVLATSALGLTMAWVCALVFALGIFAVGIAAEASWNEGSEWRFGAVALALFLCVSVTAHDPNVNLQGKQNLAKLPWDDALVLTVDGDGNAQYRIYDLNARKALTGYAPKLGWEGECYAADADVQTERTIASRAEGRVLTVRKFHPDTLVYLTLTASDGGYFTIDDGRTTNTYSLTAGEDYAVTIHSDCTVTVSGGSAEVSYREVLIDCPELIPADYDGEERLHFNLWLTQTYLLGA